MTISISDKIKKSIEAYKDFTDILTARGIRHWTDFGTLLGAYRAGSIIPWDQDMDICAVQSSSGQFESLIRELSGIGKIKRGRTEDDAFYQFTYDVSLFRIEIYVCEEQGDTVKHIFRPGFSIPRFFVDELETIQLGPYQVYAPRHVPQLLAIRYGEDFMVPQESCAKLNLSWDEVEEHVGVLKPLYSAYTPGIFDMFHVGHLKLFKRIKESFGRLVVGVHNDDQCMTYKPRPIVPYEQRLEIVRGCKYVDEVLENADLLTTNELLDRVNADYAVAGRDDADYIAKYYPVSAERLHLIHRTDGVSSSALRATCAQSLGYGRGS